ncbi:hypothetical protein VNO77_01877 [Canavalia gladiata]|uniref:Uncharacterized protein n=1 Tax=Canavalia gladiata TaxID=3824 RepID=A0AAN9MS64_CANGL
MAREDEKRARLEFILIEWKESCACRKGQKEVIPATHDSFFLSFSAYAGDHFSWRVPLPSTSTTDNHRSVADRCLSPSYPTGPSDRYQTASTVAPVQLGETILFGNGYSEAQNPVEDRENGYGGGI